MSCMKNSTFTEYEFAFVLLHSVKLKFGKQNMHKISNLVMLSE